MTALVDMIKHTLISIDYEDRERLIAVMQQAVADSLSLYLGAKQAHWNIKGRDFVALHELFESVAVTAASSSDRIAERASALGGTILAFSQAGNTSRVPTYFFSATDASDLVYMVLHSAAHCTNNWRELIDVCETLNDKVSADMFTEICSELDHLVWMLEAHMN